MSGLFNLPLGTWDPVLLEAAEITAQQLPRVLAPGSIAGHLSPGAAEALGLPPGIPVCTGANDQLVGGLGAGNVQAGVVSETTGTALAVVASTQALLDHPRLVVGTHAVPGLFYAMADANTSAVLLTWLRDLCGRSDEDYADFLAGVADIPPGCEGLSVLPYFSGGAPGSPQARGAFLGLGLNHTRDHLARAIMEACTCLLRELLEPFAGQAGAVSSVRSLGASAQNDLWLQMKADLLNLPVERPACRQSANLGAAMLAACAVGQFGSLAEASAAWYRPSRVFSPNPALVSVYQAVYERYQAHSRLVYGSSNE
jgi:xylulokinase